FLSTTMPKAATLARPTSPESAKDTPYETSQYQNKSENSFRLSPNFGKNQHLPIDDEFKESLRKILLNFNAPIRYSFAYGSGVFPQKGYELEEIKYGVISVDKLCKDLMDWETLYIKILQDDARVRLSQQVNLANALRTALLMLPKDFSEEQLYLTITGLSYEGDFRKYVGENPHKIKNIVSRQADTFKILYGSLIQGFSNVAFVSNSKLQQDDNPKARAHLLEKLPRALRNKIREQYGLHLVRKGQTLPSDDKEVYRDIASSDECVNYVKT
ncbi:21204_t:CDS:2, partial [Racocetra persica]